MGGVGEEVYYSLLKKLKSKKVNEEYESMIRKIKWREKSIIVNLERIVCLSKVSDNIENYKIKLIQKQICTKLSEYSEAVIDLKNIINLENQVYFQVAKIIKEYKYEVLENGNSRRKRLELLRREMVTQKDLFILGVEGILNDSQNEMLINVHTMTESLVDLENAESRKRYLETEIVNVKKIVGDLNELQIRIVETLHSFCQENIFCKDDIIDEKNRSNDKFIEVSEEENNIIKIEDKLWNINKDKKKVNKEFINNNLIKEEEINKLICLDTILSEVINDTKVQDLSLIKLVRKKAKLPVIKEKLKLSIREAIKTIYKNIIDRILEELEIIEIRYVVEIEKQYCIQYGNINTVNEQLQCMDSILEVCSRNIKKLNIKELISNNIIV